MTTPNRRRRNALLGLVLTCAGLALATSAQDAGDKDLRRNYALIYGTVWNRAEHPVYGAVVKIRREGQKKAHWQLFSDHRGEFAQRVPAGTADYVVWVDDTRRVSDPLVMRRKLKPGQVETKVHIENDERADIGLHLTE